VRLHPPAVSAWELSFHIERPGLRIATLDQMHTHLIIGAAGDPPSRVLHVVSARGIDVQHGRMARRRAQVKPWASKSESLRRGGRRTSLAGAVWSDKGGPAAFETHTGVPEISSVPPSEPLEIAEMIARSARRWCRLNVSSSPLTMPSSFNSLEGAGQLVETTHLET